MHSFKEYIDYINSLQFQCHAGGSKANSNHKTPFLIRGPRMSAIKLTLVDKDGHNFKDSRLLSKVAFMSVVQLSGWSLHIRGGLPKSDQEIKARTDYFLGQTTAQLSVATFLLSDVFQCGSQNIAIMAIVLLVSFRKRNIYNPTIFFHDFFFFLHGDGGQKYGCVKQSRSHPVWISSQQFCLLASPFWIQSSDESILLIPLPSCLFVTHWCPCAIQTSSECSCSCNPEAKKGKSNKLEQTE